MRNQTGSGPRTPCGRACRRRGGAAGPGHGPDARGGANFDGLLDCALRSGLLNAATVRSLDGLRHLRNLARADGDLTPRRAQEFAVLAAAVSYSMRSQPGAGRGQGPA